MVKAVNLFSIHSVVKDSRILYFRILSMKNVSVSVNVLTFIIKLGIYSDDIGKFPLVEDIVLQANFNSPEEVLPTIKGLIKEHYFNLV